MEFKIVTYILILLNFFTMQQNYEKNFICNYIINMQFQNNNDINLLFNTIEENGYTYKSIKYFKKKFPNLEIQEYENNMILFFNDINYTYDRVSKKYISEQYGLKTIKGKLIIYNDGFDYISIDNKKYINSNIFLQYEKFIDEFYSNEKVFVKSL